MTRQSNVEVRGHVGSPARTGCARIGGVDGPTHLPGVGSAEQPGGSDGTLTRASHGAPDTRLDRPAAVAVPVVLPQVVVTVDDSGLARIAVGNIDHHDAIDCPDGPICRDELGAALASIAEQVGGPVRAEVREPDGSRYADILQPRAPASKPDSDHEKGEPGEGPLLRGEGFLAGETVLVAVIATSTRADEHGAASLTSPPEPPRPTGEVVLLGSASGTIVRGSLPAHPARPMRWWRREPARRARSGNDTAINIGLGLIAALGVLAGLLRVAGTIAAWLTGTHHPVGSLGAGLAVLAHPTPPAAALRAPGLSPFAYWAVVAGLLAVVGVVAWLVVRLVRAHDSSYDPRRRAGLATTAQIRNVASGRALRRRAATLRPSLRKPSPAEVGYLLGRVKGQQVWASVEDSMLLVAPPRSGKGLHVVINAILDAPGAVVTTSTRPDNLTITLTTRQQVGPVAVFDPQHSAPGLSAGLRWSPVRGCDEPLTAVIRATGLAAGTGLGGGGGVEGGGLGSGRARPPPPSKPCCTPPPSTGVTPGRCVSGRSTRPPRPTPFTSSRVTVGRRRRGRTRWSR